jgi:hypothetical protein
MNNLPENDIELLNSLTNSKVRGFTFCGMKGCDEPIIHQNGKHAESTWGIIFHIENSSDVVLTWGEDKKIGDPFFVHLISTDNFTTIDSLELKVVSKDIPWNKYVNKKVSGTKVHCYRTNYNDPDSWQDVPWGIELVFDDSQRLLIAALHHGDFLDYLLCADEVVIIFEHELINLVIQSHSDFISEWSK